MNLPLTNNYCTTSVISAKEGHTNVVEILLKAGADLEKRHQSGCTALNKACAGNNREVVDLLCKAGADVNTQDNYGSSPLHKAVQKNNAEVVNALLAEKVQLLKNNGLTALDVAREKNYEDIAIILKHFRSPAVSERSNLNTSGYLFIFVTFLVAFAVSPIN